MKTLALLAVSVTAIKMRQEPESATLEKTVYQQVNDIAPTAAKNYANVPAADAADMVEAWVSDEKEMLTAFRDKVFENAIAQLEESDSLPAVCEKGSQCQ